MLAKNTNSTKMFKKVPHYSCYIVILNSYYVIPGRMALLVTLFLVLVNIFNTVTTNTPKAEGLTAIEAWMLSCILFVFATLIEYACLLFAKEPQEMPEINDLRR